MSDEIKKRLLRSSILAGFFAAGLVATPAMAQEADEDEDEQSEERASAAEDTIVVTGSRIRRNTFNSTSPLQVIDSEEIRDSGLIDTAQILQQSTVAQGVQLDNSINSNFVTNGGPGANNVSLRGLAPDQSLILVNGRRFAPAGIEGAPSLPDVNLIPSSMIQRIDILLDGASSVYGSDAIAGVVNVVLRDQFEGVQLDAFVTLPEQSGGESQRYGVLLGDSTERSSFIAAFEFFSQNRLEVQDRDYNFEPGEGIYCSQDLSLDADGNLLRTCDGGSSNAIFWRGNFPIIRTPGTTDFPAFFPVGWSSRPSPTPFGFETSEYVFGDDVFPQVQRFSFFATGDRELDPIFGFEGVTAFFEASYSNSQSQTKNTNHGQLFPTVSASNPFNPFGQFVVPVIQFPINRFDNETEVQQARLFGGLTGDLASFGAPEWDFELFAGYSRSLGYSNRKALDEGRLQLSLDTSRIENGEIVCGTTSDTPDVFGFLTVEQCVPINLFHPNLYSIDGGPVSFGSQEEFDYLFAVRTATTRVDQAIAGGFVTGPLFNLPAGEVSGVAGFEIRNDSLNAGTDTFASQGRASGFFADTNSVGAVGIAEIYGELAIPVVADAPFAEEITVDLAARLTDHEFYGQNETYSARASWSPTSFLTLRGTYGTSFRAPNLRELFLGGQSGFAPNSDPCVVPLPARVSLDPNDPTAGNQYDASLDNRSPVVLQNCFSEGIDPTALGLNGEASASIESFRAGNPGLDPETSTAYSFGFVFEQPFFDEFDFTFGVNIFEIEIEDSISVPSAAFILTQCYNAENFPDNEFCTRRERDPATQVLSRVDATAFNVSTASTSGADFNARFNYDVPERFFGGFNLNISHVWTWSDEILSRTTPDTGLNDFVGDWGNPEWRGTVNTRLSRGDWSVLWSARYVGEQASIYNNTESTDFPYGQRIYAPCEGQVGCISEDDPSTAFLDFSSVITAADAVWYHSLSATYSQDTWVIRAGVNNIFDEDPALVDQNASGALVSGGNAVSGSGYDLIGRRLFVNISKQF